MKPQRLKTLLEFLKGVDFIPKSLLVITEEGCPECEWAIQEVQRIDYDISFYELKKNSAEIEMDVEDYFGKVEFPRFFYFQHGSLLGMSSFSTHEEISSFLFELYYRDQTKKSPLISHRKEEGTVSNSLSYT